MHSIAAGSTYITEKSGNAIQSLCRYALNIEQPDSEEQRRGRWWDPHRFISEPDYSPLRHPAPSGIEVIFVITENISESLLLKVVSNWNGTDHKYPLNHFKKGPYCIYIVYLNVNNIVVNKCLAISVLIYDILI